jgi:hypothetical protein
MGTTNYKIEKFDGGFRLRVGTSGNPNFSFEVSDESIKGLATKVAEEDFRRKEGDNVIMGRGVSYEEKEMRMDGPRMNSPHDWKRLMEEFRGEYFRQRKFLKSGGEAIVL